VRRFQLFVLFLSVSTIFASLPAVGAVKAGTTCPRVGKVAVKSGKEFRCVKAGKKLIWRTAKKPVSAATPTPATTFKESRATQRPNSLMGLNPTDVMRVVMMEFKEFARESTLGVQINYQVGENISKEVVQFLKTGFDSGNRLFAGRFVNGAARPIFIGNEKDFDFIEAGISNLGDSSWGPRVKSEISRAGRSFTHGSASNSYIVIMFHSSFTLRDISYSYSDLAIHELTHAYQFDKLPANNQAGWKVFGCLWLEGHAEFVAQYRAWDREPDLEGFRRYYFNRDLKNDYKLDLSSKEKIISYFQLSEDVEGSRCKGMYSVGTMALEALAAVHGLEKIHDFYLEVSRGQERNGAFRETFGLSVEDFYSQVADYVISVQKKYGVIQG